MMLQAGKNITQKGDPLKKISVDYLYHALKNPKPEIVSAIRQVRLLRTIDMQRYQQAKRKLPYILTGIFNPAERLTENFAWTQYFIIDIDHLSEKELTVEQLKERLAGDQRIVMQFCSPSEDGLKLLFRLREKMYDAGRYRLFYQVFAQRFAQQYGLEQIIDTRTSDITRACFISHDPDTRYNPDAEAVNPADFVNFDNLFKVKQTQKELHKQQKNNKTQAEKRENVTGDVLDKIKATLNPNFKTKKEKQIFVPREIEEVTQQVIDQMAEKGIATTATEKIHYGKKFKFALENRRAEINLFYGKKGYSVVISPRAGTDKELNEVCACLLSEWFY